MDVVYESLRVDNLLYLALATLVVASIFYQVQESANKVSPPLLRKFTRLK